MADTLQTIADQFSSDWNSANTNSITPTFSKVFEKKRVGGLDGIQTWLAVYYEADDQELPIDLNYASVEYRQFVAVDIRTHVSYAHALNAADEARRIIHLNRKNVAIDNYNLWLMKARKDLSDATRNYWRFLIRTELVDWVEAL